MFRPQTFLVLLGAAACAFAAPHSDLTQRADSVTDTQVLQFALTLEHLENTFYTDALKKLDEQAFANAGFPSWVRGRFEQISEHEQAHVDLLTGVLGDAATKPCTYDFPYTDAKSFAALSMALESVGGSAYLGAAHLLENKDTLTTAGSILSVENQHAAWVSSAVLKGSAWSGSYATPLSVNGVYSLASQFIVSCPSTNPALPVTPLPKLTVGPASPHPNDLVKFNFSSDEVNANGQTLYVAFFDGLQVQYSELDGSAQAVVPPKLQGTVYAAVVKSKDNSPTAQEILTGLVMFEIGFPSFASNP